MGRIRCSAGAPNLGRLQLGGVVSIAIRPQGCINFGIKRLLVIRRIPGFSRADAHPITGDNLRHDVRWRDRDLSHVPPGPVILRIYVEGADLFAITLMQGDAAQ